MKTIYISEDDKKFESAEDCLEYENSLRNLLNASNFELNSLQDSEGNIWYHIKSPSDFFIFDADLHSNDIDISSVIDSFYEKFHLFKKIKKEQDVILLSYQDNNIVSAQKIIQFENTVISELRKEIQKKEEKMEVLTKVLDAFTSSPNSTFNVELEEEEDSKLEEEDNKLEEKEEIIE